MQSLSSDDPLAVAVTAAIRQGDLDALGRLLSENPGLATARIQDKSCLTGTNARSLLHIATDWPGNFSNGAATVAALIAAGADVNARFAGAHGETPLHWAASCDDVAVLDALLDHGAEIEAEGAVIGGGTPIADAAAFGQWKAAARLVERGAQTNLWQSAALGLMDRIEDVFSPPQVRGALPAPAEVTKAFWCACHGGQQPAAEYLLARGADINWIGFDQLAPLDAARRSEAHDLAAWLAQHGATSAAS